MTKLCLILQSAEADHICMDWGCFTCGARYFQILICQHLGQDHLFTPEAARLLAHEISELKIIPSRDGLIFLIRLCARFIGAEALLNIFRDSAAESLYTDMLQAKAYVAQRSLDHALRNDPARIENAQAEEKTLKAQANQDRLKSKAKRDAE